MALSNNARRWLVPGIIAVLGWAVAIPIIALAPPAGDDPLGEYKASKQYEASVERIGGKSAVLGAELNDFIGSLFHGARLGVAIGVSSLLLAAIALRLHDTKSPPAAPG